MMMPFALCRCQFPMLLAFHGDARFLIIIDQGTRWGLRALGSRNQGRRLRLPAACRFDSDAISTDYQENTTITIVSSATRGV